MIFNLIFCKIWSSVELTEDVYQNFWKNFIFDPTKLYAVSESVQEQPDDKFLYPEGLSIIHIENTCYYTDIPYEKGVEIFKASRGSNLVANYKNN